MHTYAYGSGKLANPMPIVVTLSDEEGGQDVNELLADLIGAPTITSPGEISVEDQQTSVLDVNASDPGDDTEGDGLTYSLTDGLERASTA